MSDYKKLDDIDIYISGDPTPEGDKAFTEFLKTYKAKHARSKKTSQLPSGRKKTKASAK